MDRFSMFRYIEEITEQRKGYTEENYKILGALEKELASEEYKFFGMKYIHGFADLQTLEAHAAIKLSEFVDELTDFLEVDIYNRINFTCDYLKNYFERDLENREIDYAYHPDAISYWENYDDELDSTDEKFFDSFVRNRHRLKMILPEHLVYDENTKCLKVSKLCPGFGLYMFKNLKDMFWYDKNMTQTNDKFLLSRFLSAEKCYFTDSEYYVMEKLTNINSVIVIADALCDSMTFKNVKQLMTTTENSGFRQEIDGLTATVASSQLEYSKSLILKKLFDRAKAEFSFQGELNFALRFIWFQFKKIAMLFEHYVKEESYRCFYKYLGNGEYISIRDIEMVEQLNYENFRKSFLAKHPNYRNDRLIKDAKVSLNFESIKKVHDTPSCLNVYIQKQFISYINYAERTDPLVGMVTE